MDQETPIEAVIGLEVHIQLNTNSKAFCSDSAAFGSDPNTHVGTISLAHPGTLPMINKQQVAHAIKLGLALGSEINTHSFFDRKHYFYADLPKGFQTTQDNQPICLGGSYRNIRLHHIHMEEDAGKSLHEGEQTHSQIDFNRAGVPLLEMVTEPDFRSAEEVYQFIHALRQLVQYLGISDGNMEEGSLRCDCNVSVRLLGDTHLNNRCEVKNVNSARFARKAVEHEIARQTKLFRAGEIVDQQTREFDPLSGLTRMLRSKEDAYDYRYFPEPDLPPLIITEEWIAEIRSQISELPDAKLARYGEMGIDLKDSERLTSEQNGAVQFEAFLATCEGSAAATAKFWINHVLPAEKEGRLPKPIESAFSRMNEFLKIINADKITRSVAYQKLWPIAFDSDEPLEKIAQDLDILRGDGAFDISAMAAKVIADNPAERDKYLQGKKSLLGFFMGQMMRLTKGKVDPEEAQREIQRQLEQSNKIS